MEMQLRASKVARDAIAADEREYEVTEAITKIEQQMLEASEKLEFEKAARLRDQLQQFKAAPRTGKVKINTMKGDKSKNKPAPGTPGTKVVKKTRRNRSKKPTG